MRLVITGANGFVGRQLIRDMAPEHQIVAIDRSCDGLEAQGVTTFAGDFADPALLARAFADGCDAVVHLATVPGGAAEQDPAAAWRVNIEGSAALIAAATANGQCPAMLFASSIAVFGDPMPEQIDDASPLAPKMVYGAHKAMIEQWISTMIRRGAITGMSLRFPGIVARPKGPSGMKSAFMSDVFHAARAGETFVSPVSEQATMWLMSVARLSRNLRHALAGAVNLGEPHAATLPAIRTNMAELVAEIARQTGAPADFVRYEPDAALEAAFGRQPPLKALHAEAAGLRSDGTLEALVAAALENIADAT